MNKKETTGSPGRIRTNDPAVNSRLLCHWATGEQLMNDFIIVLFFIIYNNFYCGFYLF